MAKLFLTSIDLNGNQLINTVLENAATNPTTNLAKARIAFNTAGNIPIVYDGSSWKNLQYEIPAGTYLGANANAVSATKLLTPRAFSITGGATAAAINFDGSGAVALNVTALDASKLTTTTTIPSAVLGRSSLFLGTTQVALNRPSGVQDLTGITSVELGGNTNVYLRYDSVNNAVFVEKQVGATKSAVNFYATGELAAYGVGSGLPSGGGPGATSLSALTDVTVTTPAVGNVLIYNGTHWLNKPQTDIIPNLSPYALKTYVDSKVAGIVDSAPEALDTLVELAAALGNDPNFATSMATLIGTKADKTLFETHIGDNVKHITAAERNAWNAKGSSSLTLGTTSSTAYRGDHGLIAYNHSQSTHARTDATNTVNHATNGSISVNGVAQVVYTHPTGAGNNHIPIGGSVGQLLQNSASGTGVWATWKKMGILNSSATSYTIAHGLGNADIIAQVYTSGGEAVECDITVNSTNVIFKFNVAPVANAYKYVIIG